MCVLLCEIVQRRIQRWQSQQQQRVKPSWFNNFSSSLWSILVLPGPFLPLHLSLHPSIASSLLPLYFMAAAVAGLDLEEIKNLCCFVALPCGWVDDSKVLHYLPHTNTHRKHTILEIKSIHTTTHYHPRILYYRLYYIHLFG